MPVIFSCRPWNITNNTGMMNSPSNTPETMPPAAPILMEWLPCADGPVAMLIGNKPNTNASEVINNGAQP